ncbi:MAG: hypothetical protein ACREQQ_00930 [Candidatus Binatia bacterium]
MKRAMAVGVLAAVVAAPIVALADEQLPPARIGDGEESSRAYSVRAAYSPFLVLGHGILLVLQYGAAYPIYYVTKPAVDFAYSSTDEATDLPTPAALNSRQVGTRDSSRRY